MLESNCHDIWFLSNVNITLTDILKIDGLWEFVNLTKLQLDNNIIEKIEGIDMLVNLVWLGKLFYAVVLGFCLFISLFVVVFACFLVFKSS